MSASATELPYSLIRSQNKLPAAGRELKSISGKNLLCVNDLLVIEQIADYSETCNTEHDVDRTCDQDV